MSDTDIPEAPIDMEEEYIDEDKYTTVTVEAVSVDRDGLHKPELEKPSEDAGHKQEGATAEEDSKKDAKRKYPAKKNKKFRYENKFERAVEARKQRSKRRKDKG